MNSFTKPHGVMMRNLIFSGFFIQQWVGVAAGVAKDEVGLRISEKPVLGPPTNHIIRQI
jgi:hypothetical protein